MKPTSDFANTSEAIRMGNFFLFDSFAKIRHRAIFDFCNNFGTKQPTRNVRFDVCL